MVDRKVVDYCLSTETLSQNVPEVGFEPVVKESVVPTLMAQPISCVGMEEAGVRTCRWPAIPAIPIDVRDRQQMPFQTSGGKDHLISGGRFVAIIGHSHAAGPFLILAVQRTGHDHDRDGAQARRRLHICQNIKSVHLRQVEVQYHEVRLRGTRADISPS